MQNETIKLPLNMPYITTYPANTANLAVATQHPDFSSWIGTSNIQLMLSKDIVSTGGRYAMLEFFPFGCPLINRITIPNRLFESNNIKSKIIEYLSHSFYVMLEVDLYYIEQSDCYQQYHNWQPILIYGYDHASEMFSVAGFFKQLRYQFVSVPSSNLEYAYNCLSIVEDKRLAPSKCSMCLLSVREEYTHQFCIDSMKEVINDYCNSIVPKGYLFSELLDIREVTDFVFGMDIYSLIEQYIKNVKGSHENCDLRLLHVLHQHKVLWGKRISYLHENDYISASANQELTDLAHNIIQRADAIRKYAIKYNLTRQTRILEKMLLLLPELKAADTALCNKMLVI